VRVFSESTEGVERFMKSKQIHFFALREDLLPVLDAVQSRGALKYVRTGVFGSPALQFVSRGAEIPDIGTAAADSTSACKSFLVTEDAVPVSLRQIQMADGTVRYAVDQLVNPDSIVLTPGGVWDQDVVLYGRVATVSDTAAAQALMRQFQSAFKKHFKRVKAYLVGPQALALLKAGKRLTISANSPREFDLTLGE
jgi:hypothetical protein